MVDPPKATKKRLLKNGNTAADACSYQNKQQSHSMHPTSSINVLKDSNSETWSNDETGITIHQTLLTVYVRVLNDPAVIFKFVFSPFFKIRLGLLRFSVEQYRINVHAFPQNKKLRMF